MFFPWRASLLLAMLCLFLGACAKGNRPVDPGRQDMTMRSAMEAYANGDCRRSMELFAALAASQADPGALNGLGMAQLACGQTVRAIDSFKKAVNLAPGSAALHANLGTAYFDNGNYRAAGVEFETALRNDPSSPEAILGKAGVLLEKGEADKALALFRLLPEPGMQTPEALFDKALILYRLGIYDDAEAALRECLAKNSADAPVYNALAITLLGRKKYSEALEYINMAIAREPMDGVYYYNRGNIRRAMKEIPGAIDDYGKAIAYNPDFAEAFVNRGDLLFLQKDSRAGCQDLEQACKLGRCERLEKFREMGRCLTGMWK